MQWFKKLFRRNYGRHNARPAEVKNTDQDKQQRFS
ncbi:MAG: hypothetical protein JWQ74_3748 [Marmoricola sp.]|nr:hypothetical protein [Marmoricola sp.]